jgi:hypothetical protein
MTFDVIKHPKMSTSTTIQEDLDHKYFPTGISGKCFLCHNEISVFTYKYGYIKSNIETVDNIRPICNECSQIVGENSFLNYGIKLANAANRKFTLSYDNNSSKDETITSTSKDEPMKKSTKCLINLTPLVASPSLPPLKPIDFSTSNSDDFKSLDHQRIRNVTSLQNWTDEDDEGEEHPSGCRKHLSLEELEERENNLYSETDNRKSFEDLQFELAKKLSLEINTNNSVKSIALDESSSNAFVSMKSEISGPIETNNISKSSHSSSESQDYSGHVAPIGEAQCMDSDTENMITSFLCDARETFDKDFKMLEFRLRKIVMAYNIVQTKFTDVVADLKPNASEKMEKLIGEMLIVEPRCIAMVNEKRCDNSAAVGPYCKEHIEKAANLFKKPIIISLCRILLEPD